MDHAWIGDGAARKCWNGPRRARRARLQTQRAIGSATAADSRLGPGGCEDRREKPGSGARERAEAAIYFLSRSSEMWRLGPSWARAVPLWWPRGQSSSSKKSRGTATKKFACLPPRFGTFPHFPCHLGLLWSSSSLLAPSLQALCAPSPLQSLRTVGLQALVRGCLPCANAAGQARQR